MEMLQICCQNDANKQIFPTMLLTQDCCGACHQILVFSCKKFRMHENMFWQQHDITHSTKFLNHQKILMIIKSIATIMAVELFT